MRKRDEFLKYLKSTKSSSGAATKTDSNAEWREKRNGATESVLSQSTDTKLVKMTTAIKHEEKKPMAKTTRGCFLPQLEISGRRIRDTNTNNIS